MSGAAGRGVAGVLLAAGGSRRFAGALPKQLVEIGGEPLVRRVCHRLLDSALARVVVVVGHRGEEVRAAIADLAVELVASPRWREGQSASVRAGLTAVAKDAAAAVFVPCDQPFLTAGLIDRLLDEHAASGAAIVVPAWHGRRGAPVLIDRALFAELAEIAGDEGGRQLFGRHLVVEVALAERRPLLDFDTREELARLEALAAGEGRGERG